jgi:hypothetical protein
MLAMLWESSWQSQFPLLNKSELFNFQVYKPLFSLVRNTSGLVKLVLVSAFFDARPALFDRLPQVTVVLLNRFEENDVLDSPSSRCLLQDAQGRIVRVPFVLKRSPEHWKLIFRVVFVHCLIDPKEISLEEFTPHSVALELAEAPPVFIEVSWTQEMVSLLHARNYRNESSFWKRWISRDDSTLESEFPLNQWAPESWSICTAPLRTGKTDVFLPQFLEYYKSMGSSQVKVYLESSSESLDEILARYSDFVEIIPWNLPPCALVLNDSELSICSTSRGYVHYFAQSAAINDCMLRASGQSRWVLFVDFDEFLSPQGTLDSTLTETFSLLLDQVQAAGVEPAELWGFHFFSYLYSRCNHSAWTRSLGISEQEEDSFMAFLSQYRQPKTPGVGIRSKCLVAPILIDEMRVHTPGTSLSPLSSSTALIQLNDWIYTWKDANCIIRKKMFIELFKAKLVFVYPERAHIHHVRHKTRRECRNHVFVGNSSVLTGHPLEFIQRLQAKT